MVEYQGGKWTTEQAIGISQVNLSTGEVESANAYARGDYSEQLRHEVSLRNRLKKIFKEIHMSDSDNRELMPKALIRAYEQGRETCSKIFWAVDDKDDVFWVRVDVRIVPRQETGDLIAFYNNWDVTHEKNLDYMLERMIEFDYDYLKYISTRNGHYEVMAQESDTIQTKLRGDDYNADIREYLEKVDVSDCIEQDIAALQIPTILAHLEKESTYSYEIDIREMDGSVRRKMMRYAYMNREMGTVIKSCTDIEDIVTEERKKQELLERALEEAERANGAKSEFLANMSHDIRTPMNAIIGLTSIAKDECRDENILSYLEKIEGSGKFLLSLINDILDVAKIESGSLDLKPRLMGLEELDDAINTNIRPLMESRNIHFRYEKEAKISGIYVDVVRFDQIFFNILSNAAKYTPEGGEVVFWIKCLRKEDDVEWVRFIVKDTGIGMSEEFVAHAFEPFVQETRRERALQWQGTGLGLTIVKKLVDLMEGHIYLHSVLGKGTSVVIDLPLKLAEFHGESHSSSKMSRIDELRGRQVLLVEDNEINTFVARRILETHGIEVDHAQNGQEAVAMVEASEWGYYDLILMDIRMPVMDGVEATEHIRNMEREDMKRVPIIAMTANAYDEDMQKSLHAGMNAHLSKPIEPSVLLDTLLKYLA